MNSKEVLPRRKFISSDRNYVEIRYFLNWEICIDRYLGLTHMYLAVYGHNNFDDRIWRA